MRQTAPVLLALAVVLGGCSFVADVPLIGVPSNAPPRPEGSGSYLPVHDLPPRRQEEVLTVEEQTRIYKELDEARGKGKATAKSDADALAAAAPPALSKQAGKTKKKAAN